MSEKIITMISEDGEELSLSVIEQTTIANILYILAEDEEEGSVHIMKEVRCEGEESVFEFVDSEDEWNAIIKVFEELLGDDYIFDYAED